MQIINCLRNLFFLSGISLFTFQAQAAYVLYLDDEDIDALATKKLEELQKQQNAEKENKKTYRKVVVKEENEAPKKETEKVVRKRHVKETRETWYSDIAPVLGMRLGIDQVSFEESQNIRLTNIDSLPSHFKSTEDSDTSLVWGAFAGIEVPIDEEEIYRWQTGFGYYRTTSLDTEGIIEYFGDPSDVDVGYRYNINNTRYMFENKLLMSLNELFSLYLLGSLGIANNETGDAETYQLDPASVEMLYGFETDEVNSFTYSVGLGLEMEVIEHVRVGLGYQFSDLGEAKTGPFKSPNSAGEHLENEHLFTNEFMLGVNVVFD